MRIALADWLFEVDVDATDRYTTNCTVDHCLCAYCRNFYETVDGAYPAIRPFLARFGVNLYGPSELMPFEPTLMLACYRVDGEILQWGKSQLYAKGVQLLPEAGDDKTFLLWVGEVRLPWLQKEPAEEVVSPANLPEFMERMQEIWILRHGDSLVFS